MSHIPDEYDILCDISRTLDSVNEKLERMLAILQASQQVQLPANKVVHVRVNDDGTLTNLGSDCIPCVPTEDDYLSYYNATRSAESFVDDKLRWQPQPPDPLRYQYPKGE